MYDVLPLPYQFSLMISKQFPFYLHTRIKNLPQDRSSLMLCHRTPSPNRLWQLHRAASS